jgi:hypothetical protein
MEPLWKPLSAIPGESGRDRRDRIDFYMPIPQLMATHCDSRRALCKPEVTGSIPVRSINKKPRNHGAFRFLEAASTSA